MAHDKKLAEKIRKALSGISKVEEQEKMGGVSFTVNDKMCVRAHADGGMMLRCDPKRTDELLTKKGARRFEMKGKSMMKGWLVIDADTLGSKKDFDFWMNVALEYNKEAKAAPKRKKK